METNFMFSLVLAWSLGTLLVSRALYRLNCHCLLILLSYYERLYAASALFITNL